MLRSLCFCRGNNALSIPAASRYSSRQDHPCAADQTRTFVQQNVSSALELSSSMLLGSVPECNVVHSCGWHFRHFLFVPCLEVSAVSETDAPGADLRRADSPGLPGARAAVVRRDAPRRTRLILAVEGPAADLSPPIQSPHRGPRALQVCLPGLLAALALRPPQVVPLLKLPCFTKAGLHEFHRPLPAGPGRAAFLAELPALHR